MFAFKRLSNWGRLMFFRRWLVGLILISTFASLGAYAQSTCVPVPNPQCGAAGQPACPTLAYPHTAAAALLAINTAHAAEGIPPLTLPGDTYNQAPPDRKVIMLINGERASRSLPPYNNPQSDNDPVIGYIAFNHSSLIAQLP